MKNRKSLLLLAPFLIGLALLLYPIVSSWAQQRSQNQAIDGYLHQLETADAAQLEQQKESARAYNGLLSAERPENGVAGTQPAAGGYYGQLSLQNVMGYLEIPEIDVKLPIYHGASDLTLEMGVGHLESSSLPVGGAGTHAVLVGHRGLPSSTLFRKLPKLQEGSRFYLHMLDETLAYEVDQVKVIEPDDLSDLQIVPGMDYVTLMTCTPYMINSHRLLVRGRRIADAAPDAQTAAAPAEPQPEAARASAPAWALPAGLAAALMLCIALLARKKGRGEML